MSDTNAQEPTMEEILASIRRIISEDDAPAAAEAEPAAVADEAPAAPAEEPPAPTAPMVLDEEDEEDILELTEPEPEPEPAPVAAAPSPAQTMGDIEVFPRPTPRAPEPEPAPAFTAAADFDEPDDDGLLGLPAASQAASAFSQLSRTVSMPSEGRNLEDVVREMLRPLLKDWLDTHLSGIVETVVQAEVERISRRRF